MNTDKLNILFLIAKNRIRQDGKAPIFCRLTFHKKRKQFSTGFFTEPNTWNIEKHELKPNLNNDYEFINTQLSLIKQKLNQAFLLLQVQGLLFDVEDIYLTYAGVSTNKNKSFLEVMALHNNRMSKLIGVEYAPRYYQKWEGMLTIMKEFIKKTYSRNDFTLSKLTLKFLDDLDFYCKTEKNHKQITINKCIQRVRQIIRFAMSEGFIDKDPFILYKAKRYKKEVVFLTTDELKSIEQHTFRQKRLEQVKDLFIFCCYTGLAYAEMSELKDEHIITGYDDNKWISMHRKKTGKHFSIPLLDKPVRILEKYKDLDTDKALPKISNQKFNSYIKEICEIVGIEKTISHHIARKTFATTVLLYNDVPMEIVSELLGHSKITVTQEHYAKVVQKKVGLEVQKLSKKLSKN